jgi:L-ribulokinase
MNVGYTVGLDFGTNSVRALVVRADDGSEVGTHVHGYEHGEEGILLDERDPNLARQHPADYLSGLQEAVRKATEDARKNDPEFDPSAVVALGVDTTGSTPIPCDASGSPLAFDPRFGGNLNTMAWLWKDHTGYAEAAKITEKAREIRPHYLLKCGGVYSSEWFFSKIWHCLNADPQVFRAAHIWMECADWIPAMLTGNQQPGAYKPSVCAAGHKAMYNDGWGGLPDAEFLGSLDPALGKLRDRLFDKAYTIDVPAGNLTQEWAERLGLPPGIPVAVGAFDAHLGAVGSGIKPGVLVKIIGTSTCDMAVAPSDTKLPDIPGICGIVDGSIVPKHFGMEAGQSAVGDIFNWFVSHIGGTHEALSEAAGMQ